MDTIQYKVYSFELTIEYDDTTTVRKQRKIIFTRRYSEFLKFHNTLEQNKTIKQLMTDANIKFPKKSVTDCDIRAEQLKKYMKFLLREDDIICNKWFLITLDFDPNDDSQWSKIEQYNNDNSKDNINSSDNAIKMIMNNNNNKKQDTKMTNSNENVSEIDMKYPATSDQNDDGKVDDINENNTSSKPIKTKKRTLSGVAATGKKKSEESNFQLKISPNVSRIDMNRTMLMGKFYKHFYDHSDVRLIYFNKEKKPKTHKKVLVIRIFLVELYREAGTNNVILSTRGPLTLKHLKYINGYYCNQLYELKNANVTELESIAQYTIKNHGEHNSLRNNCHHFNESFMNNIIACNTLDIYKDSGSKMRVTPADEQDQRMTPQMFDKYIREYFYASLTFTKGENEDEDEDADEIESKIDTITEEEEYKSSKSQSSHHKSNYTPLDFTKVLKEFPIVKNKDQPGTLAAGYLKTSFLKDIDEKEHDYPYEYRNDYYYVLTDTSQLMKYQIININSEVQNRIKQKEIKIKKGDVVLDDTNDCAFIIDGNIILTAKNVEIARDWKIAFVKCGGLQDVKGDLL